MDNGNGNHVMARQASVGPVPGILPAGEELDDIAINTAVKCQRPVPEMLSVGLLSVILGVPEAQLIVRARREAWPGNATHVPGRITTEYRVSGLPIAIQTEVRAQFRGPDPVPVQRDQPGKPVGYLYHRRRWDLATAEMRRMAELRAQFILELQSWLATHTNQAEATAPGFLASIQGHVGPPQARRLFLQIGRPVARIVYRWRAKLARFGVHALVPRAFFRGHGSK